MKTATDPRHKRREQLVQQLFAAGFQKSATASVANIWKNLGQIDPLIAQAAPEWPLDKLNRMDLAILRLAVYELVVDKRQPYKVIIDEAVELAKQYGATASPTFINGVLGHITDVYATQNGHLGISG